MNIIEFLRANTGYYEPREIAKAVGMADSYVAMRIDELAAEGLIEGRKFQGQPQWRLVVADRPMAATEKQDQQLREQIIEGIKQYGECLDRPPTARGYRAFRKENNLPSLHVIERIFGTWNAAVNEAGLITNAAKGYGKRNQFGEALTVSEIQEASEAAA